MYITFQQVEAIHNALVDFFEKDGDPISPSGVKSKSLLESALFRPQTSLGGIDKYKTTDEKAAALLCSIIQNHPFHNGNKRTALVATLAYYDALNHTINAQESEIYDFLICIAKGCINDIQKEDERFFNEVVKWLRSHRYSFIEKFTDIKTETFAKKCKARGANYKKSKANGCYVISHNGKSIRISQSTKRITAKTAKSYLSELQLCGNYTGLNLDEILRGSIENNSCFQQIVPLLRKLALV